MGKYEGRYKFRSSKHAMAYFMGVYFHQHEYPKEMMYIKLNKLYKQVDFSKDFIINADADALLKDDNKYFYCLQTLHKKGLIEKFNPHKRNNETYCRLDGIEQEMLRREMCCYKNDLITKKEQQVLGRNKRALYEKTKEQVIVKIDGKEHILGYYTTRRMKKVKETIKILLKYKDKFGKEVSPIYMYKFFKLLITKGEDTEKINKWFKKYKRR